MRPRPKTRKSFRPSLYSKHDDSLRVGFTRPGDFDAIGFGAQARRGGHGHTSEDTVLKLIFFIGRLLDSLNDSWDDDYYIDDPLAS